jgi:hypothetical protein
MNAWLWCGLAAWVAAVGVIVAFNYGAHRHDEIDDEP